MDGVDEVDEALCFCWLPGLFLLHFMLKGGCGGRIQKKKKKIVSRHT